MLSFTAYAKDRQPATSERPGKPITRRHRRAIDFAVQSCERTRRSSGNDRQLFGRDSGAKYDSRGDNLI
jgi:hypothetical protein